MLKSSWGDRQREREIYIYIYSQLSLRAGSEAGNYRNEIIPRWSYQYLILVTVFSYVPGLFLRKPGLSPKPKPLVNTLMGFFLVSLRSLLSLLLSILVITAYDCYPRYYHQANLLLTYYYDITSYYPHVSTVLLLHSVVILSFTTNPIQTVLLYIVLLLILVHSVDICG